MFVVMAAVNAVLLVVVMQLIILHIFLWTQDLTIFEYIKKKLAKEGDARNEKFDSVKAAAGKLGQRIRTLPHCMDWMIFCRCGQRRRGGKRKGDKPNEGPSRMNRSADTEVGAIMKAEATA